MSPSDGSFLVQLHLHPALLAAVGPITTAAATAAAVSAADAECIVSVIVLMVSRLDKDDSLAETASKLANSIGKQVRLRCGGRLPDKAGW